MYLANRLFDHQIVGSLAECRIALELEPDNPSLHAITAEYYESNGDSKSQLRELREAARLAPFDSYLRERLADLLEKSGEQTEAIQEWVRFVAISPRDREGSNALVALYRKNGDLESATKELQRSLNSCSIASPDPEVYAGMCRERIESLAEILCKRGEFRSALEQLNSLFQYDPESANLHNRIANVYFADKQWENAAKNTRNPCG